MPNDRYQPLASLNCLAFTDYILHTNNTIFVGADVIGHYQRLLQLIFQILQRYVPTAAAIPNRRRNKSGYSIFLAAGPLTTFSHDVRATVGDGNAPLSWLANRRRRRE